MHYTILTDFSIRSAEMDWVNYARTKPVLAASVCLRGFTAVPLLRPESNVIHGSLGIISSDMSADGFEKKQLE
jgi:hypothetical protein